MSDLSKVKIYEVEGSRGVVMEIDDLRVRGLRGYTIEREWNQPKIIKIELLVGEIEIVKKQS